MEITKDIKQNMEKRLQELAASQGDFFKKKKEDRNLDELASVREQLNRIKAVAKKVYKGKELSEEEQQIISNL